VRRDGDLVARLGGDEFAIVAHDTDAGSARKLADEIVVRLLAPYRVLGGPVEAGASVGIKTVGFGDKFREPATLLRAADEALYAAKRAGKGRAMSAKLRTAA
jgi:diguanylate cyclase (GGDEF)-like protein